MEENLSYPRHLVTKEIWGTVVCFAFVGLEPRTSCALAKRRTSAAPVSHTPSMLRTLLAWVQSLFFCEAVLSCSQGCSGTYYVAEVQSLTLNSPSCWLSQPSAAVIGVYHHSQLSIGFLECAWDTVESAFI